MPTMVGAPPGQTRVASATSPWPGAAAVPGLGGAQPVYDAGRCDLNGACAQACPVGAISVGATFSLDRARCISCSRCIEVCPTGALAAGLAFAAPARSREELLEPVPAATMADALTRPARALTEDVPSCAALRAS